MGNRKYSVTFSIMLGILTMLTMHSQLGQPIYAAAHTSGYNHGCSDAQISDPSERYINQPEKGSSLHSDAFMQAYNEGFNSCSSPYSGSDTPNIPRNNGEGPSGTTSGNSLNKNFDWRSICNTVSVALVQPCNVYVNPDGTFSPEGERAFGCIRNGVFMAGGAMAAGVPTPFIIGGLKLLAGQTGSDNIVNWGLVGLGDLKSLHNLLPH